MSDMAIYLQPHHSRKKLEEGGEVRLPPSIALERVQKRNQVGFFLGRKSNIEAHMRAIKVSPWLAKTLTN
jgi:hypothetical protein